MSLLTEQQQYLTLWHDSFVSYTAQLRAYVEGIRMLPGTTEADKVVIEGFKALLHRKEVMEVEQDLLEGNVKQSTLDKIERLDKDMVDFALDHLSGTPALKVILRTIFYHVIDWNKQSSVMRLKELDIRVLEDM